MFIAPDGDHYRVRLTHSLEVAQIGRTIARALGLNEDLTEALCLAHDLGHPPFGHAGEDALNAALADAGGFDHNAQTIRIVTRLEKPYPVSTGSTSAGRRSRGWRSTTGRSPSRAGRWPRRMPNGISSSARWPGLEAQVAAISDDIAYDNHDIDDGLRAGLLDIDELVELPLVRRLWDAIGERHPGLSLEKRQRALVRDMIGTMVGDVLAETERRVREAGVETIDEVRAAGRPLAGFSGELAAEERELKRFLYDRLYGLPELQAHPRGGAARRRRARRRLSRRPRAAAAGWQRGGDEFEQLRTIGDFIAGMTDRFAIARHEELVGPVNLPSGRF